MAIFLRIIRSRGELVRATTTMTFSSLGCYIYCWKIVMIRPQLFTRYNIVLLFVGLIIIVAMNSLYYYYNIPRQPWPRQKVKRQNCAQGVRITHNDRCIHGNLQQSFIENVYTSKLFPYESLSTLSILRRAPSVTSAVRVTTYYSKGLGGYQHTRGSGARTNWIFR